MKRSAVALLAAVLFSSVVAAQPGPRREGPQDGRMRQERADILEVLNLTPEQEAEFAKLRSEHQKAMVRGQADIRLAQIDLGGLMQADQPDKKQIAAKMREVSDLQHQQKIIMLDHMFEVRSILTPEQIKLWNEHHRVGDFGMDGGGPCRGEFSGRHDGFRHRELHDPW
jgi:Spy/CpxP family protein refolding chaperone